VYGFGPNAIKMARIDEETTKTKTIVTIVGKTVLIKTKMAPDSKKNTSKLIDGFP
jgi:hypothetical protein